MASMSCLNRCVPEDEDNFKEDLFIDLEKVILKCAMEYLRLAPPHQLTCRERLCCRLERVLALEVDRSYLGVKPVGDMKFTLPVESRPGLNVLFQSRYKNDTDHTQFYSFKTERQTKSSLEVSLQRGFTVGSSLQLGFKVNVPAQNPDCELSGSLGGHMDWKFERGKISRQEDTATWSVDSQVAVSRGMTGEARLNVKESRFTAPFILSCRITPLTDNLKIPVFVRRRKTGAFLQMVFISCDTVADECDYFRCVDDGGAMECDLKGVCSVVCKVAQEVWLSEALTLVRQPDSSGKLVPV